MDHLVSEKNESSGPSEKRRLALAAGLIVLAALLVYSNSFFGPRVLDDDLATSKNPSIRHLWPIWPVLSPPEDLPVAGRPVLNLSFALNYALSRDALWSYHVFNLAVHTLAALVLFGVVRRTLQQPALRPNFGADALPLAAAVALLWVVHPAQTAAVTYLSQRAESLMGLFYLLTLYGLIRASETSTGPSWKLWSVVSVTACALGMLTKEVMVTAPLMALIYDRTFWAGSFREAWRLRWRLHAALAGTWMVLAYEMLDFPQRGSGWIDAPGLKSWDYALTECRAVFHYLILTVWPDPLVFDFGTRQVHQPLHVLPQALVLVALLALTAIVFVRCPVLGFAGVWFFLILAPTSSFIPIPASPEGEHRLYLPMAATLTLIVLGLYSWLGRDCRFAILATAVVFGAVTYERNEVYQSPFALYTDTLAKVPDNARAMTGIGMCNLEQGKLDEAITQFQRAIVTDSKNAIAYYDLGKAFSQANRMDEAIPAYQQAIRYAPNFADAHYNLGRAFSKLRKLPESVEQFRLAVKSDPNDTDAYIYLGSMLAQLGHFDEALPNFARAVELNPDSVQAHNDWGIVLAIMGRKDEAAAQYREALRLDPDYFQAQHNLAELERPRPATHK